MVNITQLSHKSLLRQLLEMYSFGLFLFLKFMLILLLNILFILLYTPITVIADGWDASKPSHQTLYIDTLTSKTDASSVNVADSFFVSGEALLHDGGFEVGEETILN